MGHFPALIPCLFPVRRRHCSNMNLRRSRHNSSWASYIARPLHECKFSSYEEKVGVLKAAEEFQSRLESPQPFLCEIYDSLPRLQLLLAGTFVHNTCVCSSRIFVLTYMGLLAISKGLPSRFCVDVQVVLEDEEGEEYEAVYIGRRSALSGGWKRFGLDHKLDDGDALLFELVEPKRFKDLRV